MAQANIKDRIKEMRLRVLAEPLGEAAAKLDSSQLSEDDILADVNPEDNIGVPPDNPKTDTPVREKTTKTETLKKPKLGKKKTSKKSKKQKREKAGEISRSAKQEELEVLADGQMLEIKNEPDLEKLKEQPEDEIRRTDINRKEELKESIQITEPIADDSGEDEHKNSSDEIIELTDKWVELEVRSRLSGLEKQEKQTRAMLKEIVEILDRIETPKYSKQISPAIRGEKIAPISPPSQSPESTKLYWVDIIKRMFVVIGTFVLFAGIIWGVLLYLFFDI